MRGNVFVPIIRNGGRQQVQRLKTTQEIKSRGEERGGRKSNMWGKEKAATEILSMLKTFEEWLCLLLHFKLLHRVML